MIKTELLLLILSIIGALIAIGIAGNAFFLKGIFADLNDVKLNIARIFERSTHSDKVIDELRGRVELLEKDILSQRERLHSLESERKSLLAFVEDFNREKK